MRRNRRHADSLVLVRGFFVVALTGCALAAACARFSEETGPADAQPGSDASADSGGSAVDATSTGLGCGASDAGLVAYWPMEEGQGTAISDCSGNALGGTVVGNVTWGAGHDGGKALVFDGNPGNFVELGNPGPLQLTGSMTLAAWVYFEAGHDSVVIGKGGGPTDRGWSLNREPTNELNFFVAASATAEVKVSAPMVPSARWMHVASVYAAGVSMSIYLDGKESASIANVPPSMRDPALAVQLGQRSDGCCSMQGRIDEVRVYNRALTAGEIAALAAE